MVPENIRIKFHKKGRLIYISHLDLCRTVCPAMIRAKIPVWYTEGYNPHPKMVFAQPLPLFVESRCELLDIRITEHIGCDEIEKRLREALTPDLYVEEVYTGGAKFREIEYAVYSVICDREFADAAVTVSDSGSLPAEKKVKTGTVTADILPQVRSLRRTGDNEIECVLSASASSYLNPVIFCKAVADKYRLGDVGSALNIVRTGWLKKDLTVFR